MADGCAWPFTRTILSSGCSHTGRQVSPSAFTEKEAEAPRTSVVSLVHRR